MVPVGIIFIGSNFGENGYYVERAGISFECFMLVKFLIRVLFILEAFEIQELSKNTIGFWKTLLGAFVSNLFLHYIAKSIYQTPKDDENS